MAVDFPTNPVDGSTYEYQNVVYVYVTTSGADGYWAVRRPGQLSPATSGELNEGTSNTKYATPLGLAGSKYVREDQAIGETVLNHSGAERLKTTAQGVETSGRLTLGGDTYKDGIKVGRTTLIDDEVLRNGEVMITREQVDSYDMFIVYGGSNLATHGFGCFTVESRDLAFGGTRDVLCVADTGGGTSTAVRILGYRLDVGAGDGVYVYEAHAGSYTDVWVRRVVGIKFP